MHRGLMHGRLMHGRLMRSLLRFVRICLSRSDKADYRRGTSAG